MTENQEVLSHDDIAFMAESVLQWAHEFVALVKSDHDENWFHQFEKHLMEVKKYDEIIESYEENSSLPAPDTCLHVEILYVMKFFAELQMRAARLAMEQIQTYGHQIEDCYGGLELNLQMNIAIRWMLSLEHKMNLRKENKFTDFNEILNRIAEEY